MIRNPNSQTPDTTQTPERN